MLKSSFSSVDNRIQFYTDAFMKFKESLLSKATIYTAVHITGLVDGVKDISKSTYFRYIDMLSEIVR